jgi:hypothetical protein
MGGCPPSLWHRFQRYTLSGERFDFVRWVPPGSRLFFTQRVHLMGSNLPRLVSRPCVFRSTLPAPLLPSRSAGRVRASRGSERDSVASG